ncbi:MAG: membrane protein insertase YidC [Bacilli bacterium]|nr:membrane protein insertase YidC [Bacilli bacterium]
MKNTLEKKSHKSLFAFLAVGVGLLTLTSCTANFCSDEDRAQMAYPYDQGVTVYCTEAEYNSYKADNAALVEYEESIGISGKVFDCNDNIYKYVPYQVNAYGIYEFTGAKTTFLQGTVLKAAYSAGYPLPSLQYWAEIDNQVLEACVYMAYQSDRGQTPTFDVTATNQVAPDTFKESLTAHEDSETVWSISAFTKADSDTVTEDSKIIKHSVLRQYGYLKFTGKDNKLWANLDQWYKNAYASNEAGLGIDGCPTSDFMTYYQTQVNNKVANIRSCIATRTGSYGHYGSNANWEVNITKKDWGYAWSKGFLEGLLVYPVSWLVDTFAFSFDSSLSGVGQIWALILVTLIVRGLLMLVTFRSTMSQQKMTALQPELAKLQAKYPNSNTNQAEKQKLAQEQMALYRRNKIHPMGQILVLIIQFPVFICVWSGLQGASTLSTGQVLNLRLSDNINTILMNVSGTWYANTTGWWTALVLFLLMAGVQIMAMVLPRIIQKRAQKNAPKLSANPAQTDQQKQMKMMSIVMVGFTIVMGFMLPAAMGVYWLISGLLSMLQTLITQLIIRRRGANKKTR